MEGIYGFHKEYRFLSNFWECKVEYDDWVWPSAEHAYQAAKTNVLEIKKIILACKNPAETKKLGKNLKLREDWEEVKLQIMEDIVRNKFSKEPLKSMLLDTKELYLEETNWWHDKFWGVCRGVGENNLGKILMKIRGELSVGL